jgi:N-dimethylarginine dimethylaminohydrolase
MLARASSKLMPRTILMSDPKHFGVHGGANPHTRNVLGIKRRVDPDAAYRQWHSLARAFIAHSTEVCVIPAHPRLSGLVYPANAGFLYPLESHATGGPPSSEKTFYLAHLLPTRAAEREVYRPFIRAMGYPTNEILARFEGEADFFPAGRFMLFTHGVIERQRFVPRFGLPPWKRIYGFRSETAALDELRLIAGERPVLELELCLEAHYHGDTVLCSFGAEREFLLAYMAGLTMPSRERLRQAFGNRLIELSEHDAALYAANSFQIDYRGRFYLFMPDGISEELLNETRARGVEPVLVNVSEFLAKGGGSVKCMILDLGPREQQPSDPAAAAFRAEHGYERLFPAAGDNPS